MASTTKKATASKSTDAVDATEPVAMNEQIQDEASDAAVSTPATKKKVEEKPIIAKDVDPGEYVTVRNGFHGKLVYKSPRTGECYIWDEFGAEQDMELRELKNARSSQKKFFVNNWFMFDEDWIVDYLGVKQLYKHAVSVDHFDDIFSLSADELKSAISEMSDGQKKSVAYRAKELITDKKLDSLSVISVLEDALGIELIER